jgi:hypothetical protein
VLQKSLLIKSCTLSGESGDISEIRPGAAETRSAVNQVIFQRLDQVLLRHA